MQTRLGLLPSQILTDLRPVGASLDLTGEPDDRREFAGFYPYDIPGARPPEDLVEAFPAKVRELRETFAVTLPGTIGVLVDV